MKLTPTILETLCQTAITAAKNAGQLINEYTGKNVEVKNKKAADSLAAQVVTEVDVKAQNVILKILAPTLKKYDLALLTEESPDDKSRFEKNYFWCIDPMDGTLAFTEKKPGYAVSIALVSKNGEPVIGVVYDPVTNILYHALKGKGTFRNELPWQPELSAQNKPCFTLHMDRTFSDFKYYNNFISELKDMLNEMNISKLHIQHKAGGVLNAIWSIDQAPGCYFKLPKATPGGGSLWDFAATACIFKEAGAYAQSFDGSPLDLNRLDSTFMNHKGVIYSSDRKIARRVKNILDNFLS